MILTTLIAAIAASAADPQCRLELISSAPGENHVLFHGLSRDGGLIAVGWDRGVRPDMKRGAFLLDLNSGKRTDLPHLNNAPSFSPDGRFLVAANYSGDPAAKTEIVELDRRTGAAKTHASSPALEWLASYSRDGKRILFNSTRSGGSDLYSISRAGGEPERITHDERYEAHGQYFDSDRMMIFHRQTSGDNYDIIIRNLGTGVEHPVGATPAEEAYPAISPDGRWIAFSAVTAPGQQPHLFLMRSDGSGKRQLTQDSAKDAYAAWAPNGRSIYFVRFATAGSRIYRIRVRNGRCRA